MISSPPFRRRSYCGGFARGGERPEREEEVVVVVVVIVAGGNGRHGIAGASEQSNSSRYKVRWALFHSRVPIF